MLCLYETPAGFALFKVLDEKKLKKVDDIWQEFESPERAAGAVKLKAFSKFDSTTDALAAAASLVDSKAPKQLRKFLKKHVGEDTLAVVDAKLGKSIADKLGLRVVSGAETLELARGIRSQFEDLVAGLESASMTQMALGLSHSLSRYKLKFSPDKIDTMIVQAIGLLDDLDKELNTYSMRVREWYGWHFPELSRLIEGNLLYARVVTFMGTRDAAAALDFSALGLPEETEAAVKDAAVVSMGTEMAAEDLEHVRALCGQVIELSEYRAQLYEYLKNRMQAIAPNLTILVGELVGARLIAHAGTLLNLAKAPASTVQILGAEKALFRALKTKHATPKYGLIFHASLIGQASPKNKGKIARVLAAKASLAVRMDALGDDADVAVGVEGRAKVEVRLRQLEGRELEVDAVTRGTGGGPERYSSVHASGGALATPVAAYNPDADVVMAGVDPVEGGEAKKTKKKKRKAIEGEDAADAGAIGEEAPTKKKKKSKKAHEGDGENGRVGEGATEGEEGKKGKKLKAKAAVAGAGDLTAGTLDDGGTPKKKKKKSKPASSS